MKKSELGGPGQALELGLAAQGLAAIARRLGPNHLHREPAARVLHVAAAVASEAALEIVGDPAVERAVAAAEEVHVPARRH